MKRQAHFNLFVANHDYHEASWKVSPNGAKGAIGLDHFIEVDHVMPILQARGVAPREYAPGTLRDQLGLSRPVNTHSLAHR